MRLRNKPNAPEILASYPQYVPQKPENLKGSWKKKFKNKRSIHIEVGTGKGKFIHGMAKLHPDINFIGVELQASVVIRALEKQIEEPLPNLQLLHVSGGELTQYFDSNEVDRIYLNFSDPWPKNRHEKRRLTYKTFLAVYEDILVTSGEIHFKTDNQGLFEYSLVSFSKYGMVLQSVCLDLHNSNYEGNIMTEYEEKFSAKGNRIYRTEVRFQSKSQD
ncbi:MAG: tRNA (guanosine(46)-N7)-methyltransferase TrmB [Pisciglobus halotolerans]|nr:tRNA (guanosine(46)-N7)-methyltransferase TrmB [Pisciglobus halotolerans]